MSSLAVFMVLGGGAYAATTIPGHDGVIHGCYQKQKGSLRVIPTGKKCQKKSEIAISWNQKGIPGSPGSAGAPGANGAPGVAGVPGAPGTPATKLFAQIKADGTINVASPGITASRYSAYPGAFLVNFGQSITRCVVTATQGGVPVFGSPGLSTGRAVGSALVNISEAGIDYTSGYPTATTAMVETFSGSTAAYSSFYVVAFC